MKALEGKVSIVTGASRGIGKGIAAALAAEGARVICAARTLQEGGHVYPGSLETTVNRIRAAGGEATAVVCNISEEADCRRLVEQTRAIYGPCEVLVNNAALSFNLPVVEFPFSKWVRAFAISFHAPFFLSQLVLPEMVARHAGAIVNITSGRPVINGPGSGPYPDRTRPPGGVMYGAAKAALERFTQGLAFEVYADGISVTCVGPSRPVATRVALERKVLDSVDDPRGEPPEMMGQAVVLLATAPLDRVTGRVTYSQAILKEFGWIGTAVGSGVDEPGSYYSEH